VTIYLKESELSISIVNFLNKCSIYTLEDLLKYDEDSLMRLVVGDAWVLSRKRMHELKEFIHSHAPSRFDEVGCFLPAIKETNKK